MTIWRWGSPPGWRNAFQEVERLQREMNRLWDQVSSGRVFAEGSRIFPPVIVSEDNEYYYVRAELPGVKAEDLDLSVVNDQLILRGEKKTTEEGEKVNYHRKEREEGVFRRVIALPARVNVDKVEAKTQNGILTVKLAKAEEVKPKPIQIQTG